VLTGQWITRRFFLPLHVNGLVIHSLVKISAASAALVPSVLPAFVYSVYSVVHIFCGAILVENDTLLISQAKDKLVGREYKSIIINGDDLK
jgi:hypothetical protein